MNSSSQAGTRDFDCCELGLVPVGLVLALFTFNCCGLGLMTKGLALRLRLFKMAEFPTLYNTNRPHHGGQVNAKR